MLLARVVFQFSIYGNLADLHPKKFPVKFTN